MNHSFTFHPSLSPLYTRIPHDDPIDSRSLSTHITPTRSEPWRTSLAKCPLKENGHPRAEVGTYRDIGNVQSTVPYPAWRHRSTHSSQMFSRIIAKWLPLSARHYTTGCSLSPHATSHFMIVPSRRPGASEAAGRDALRDCREVLGEIAPSAACHTTRPAVPNRIIDFCHRPTCALRGTRHSGCEDSSPSV